MSEYVRPVHALGFFDVHENGEVTQIVVFDYYDPKEYYRGLVASGDIEDELARLAYNMQSELDKELVKINGEKVRPKVTAVDIQFRGAARNPSITFFIKFRGRFKKGVNTYENYYEGVEAEYPYEVYWIFPRNFKVVNVVISGEYEVVGNVLMVWVEEGTMIKGYEKIEFLIP